VTLEVRWLKARRQVEATMAIRPSDD
jgi:hypothetical protein